ncbi:MAG TPA: TIR domain-containing protein [Myxococcales bacterium]
MAQVFISYAKEDRERIRPLADAFRASGIGVFWDRSIPPGSTWREVLERELRRARCIVVVWSKTSIASRWVSEEADYGHHHDILIPIRIDEVEPPIGFRTLQAADFAGWSGQAGDPAFVELLSTVRGHTGEDAVHVIVREEQSRGLKYRVSIGEAGTQQADISTTRSVDSTRLERLLTQFAGAVARRERNMEQFGREFAAALLSSEARRALAKMKRRHIVIVHDEFSGRIPWETLTIGRWTPALAGGLSRRYLPDRPPAAGSLEARRSDPVLRVLLVVNSLGDLAGADEEGRRIERLAGANKGFEIKSLAGAAATKAEILAALRTGKFDCMHYAGHALFDWQGSSRCGLICADTEILSGADLIGIPKLPSLVFFYAAEAGRVRGRRRASSPPNQTVPGLYWIAEALMRGGLANFMTTSWDIQDESETTFTSVFYRALLAGKSLGAALLKARKAVRALPDRDWAGYQFYGDFGSVLKPAKGK